MNLFYNSVFFIEENVDRIAPTIRWFIFLGKSSELDVNGASMKVV